MSLRATNDLHSTSSRFEGRPIFILPLLIIRSRHHLQNRQYALFVCSIRPTARFVYRQNISGVLSVPYFYLCKKQTVCFLLIFSQTTIFPSISSSFVYSFLFPVEADREITIEGSFDSFNFTHARTSDGSAFEFTILIKTGPEDFTVGLIPKSNAYSDKTDVRPVGPGNRYLYFEIFFVRIIKENLPRPIRSDIFIFIVPAERSF